MDVETHPTVLSIEVASALKDGFQHLLHLAVMFQLVELMEISEQVILAELRQKLGLGRGIELLNPINHFPLGHFRCTFWIARYLSIMHIRLREVVSADLCFFFNFLRVNNLRVIGSFCANDPDTMVAMGWEASLSARCAAVSLGRHRLG